MSKSPEPKPLFDIDETILKESQYQYIFSGCSALTQCPELPNVLKTPAMFPKHGVGEPIPATSEPLSADGFDWSENERKAYEL